MVPMALKLFLVKLENIDKALSDVRCNFPQYSLFTKVSACT